MKKTRLLLTLWLMLLTAVVPPMAFACASVCAINSELMTAVSQVEVMADMDMSHCHEADMAVTDQADNSHPANADVDKATPCLANIMCHLTVGINTTPPVLKILATYSPTVVPHTLAFIPQVALSPPDKPPRV